MLIPGITAVYANLHNTCTRGHIAEQTKAFRKAPLGKCAYLIRWEYYCQSHVCLSNMNSQPLASKLCFSTKPGNGESGSLAWLGVVTSRTPCWLPGRITGSHYTRPGKNPEHNPGLTLGKEVRLFPLPFNLHTFVRLVTVLHTGRMQYVW